MKKILAELGNVQEKIGILKFDIKMQTQEMESLKDAYFKKRIQ